MPCAQGENAWVFVNEECIGETVKHYFKFEEDLFNEAKKVAAKGQEVKKPTEVASVVMSGRVLSAAEVSKHTGTEHASTRAACIWCGMRGESHAWVDW